MKDVLRRILFLRPSTVLVLLFVATSAKAQPFDVSGHMQHTTLEGGCWSLMSYEGKPYELVGDSASLIAVHKNGAIVDLTVEPVKNAASICMIGEIVRIVQVKDVRMQPYDAPITPTKVNGTVRRTKSGTWYVEQKNGIRYELQEPIDKRLRHVGAHYKATVMINSDHNIIREHMDGLILHPPKPGPAQNAKIKAPRQKYDPK